ncbi:MAG: RNA polymerase sigma factor [Pirellulales bacterium]
MPDEVRDLVRRGLAKDEAALAELVERFGGQVFGLCYRLLGHRQDAEDVTQESFVRAFRSLASWDNSRDFVPWLLAIAGNRCRSWLAARLRRPRPTDEVDHLPDRAPDYQQARHLAEEVDLALASLRDEYRQAFVLFHEHHLSYAEIAVAMSCPLGTVKTWVHRARRQLADDLRRRGVVEENYHAVRRI